MVDFTIDGNTFSAGDTATIAGVGTLQINSNGSFTFIPVANFNGTVPAATYTTTDGSGTNDTSNLNITVNPVNDDFTDADESFNVDEDTTLSDNILSGTSSADGPVTVSVFSVNGTSFTAGDSAVIPGIGTLQIDSDGALTFTPEANYNGPVPPVTYTTTDGSGNDDTSTLSITVDPVNDDFTDSNESFNINEDTPLSDTVLAGTSSVDGPVTVSDFTINGTSHSAGDTAIIPGVGTLQINSNGTFIFTPIANFNGATPAIDYTTTDGTGIDDTSTLSITVDPVNDDFTDADEAFNVNEDGNLNENILAGSSSVDGPLSISDFTVGGTTYNAGDVATLPGVGTLQINSDGTITFTPVANFNGTTPPIAYTVTDGSGNDDTSNVTITVDPVNDDFTDTDETFSVDEDNTLTDNVLSGTSSADGPVTIANFTVGGTTFSPGGTAIIPGVGTLQINVDGTFDFTPVANFNGPVPGVTYTTTDGSGNDDSSTLSITVNPVNDGPTTTGNIANQNANDGDTIAPVNVSTFFNDIDATDTLNFNDNGTLPPGLSIDPDTGIISGQIASDASTSGPYSVTITATDSGGQTAQQTFVWTVENPAPTANNNSTSISEDASTPISANLISTNTGSGIDSDPDNDVLSIDSIDGTQISGTTQIPGQLGTLTVDPNGDYQYNIDPTSNAVQSLAPGQSIFESFTYTVSDGQGGTATAQLVIEIIGANDAPTQSAAIPNQIIVEDEPITPLNVSDFATDIDNLDVLTFDDQGTLPPGLTLDPATGIITGTIDTELAGDGPFDVTVLVTDSHGATTEVSIQWNAATFFQFDAFNNIASDRFDTFNDEFMNFGGSRDLVLSQQIHTLAPEPILAGSATPGTVLVGRIYAADGSIIGEAKDTANSAGNWVINFNDVQLNSQVRIVIEHVATEEVALGDSNISLDVDTYRSLQLGTTQTESMTAGSILSSRPFSTVNEMGHQNINPLDLLTGDG